MNANVPRPSRVESATLPKRGGRALSVLACISLWVGACSGYQASSSPDAPGEAPQVGVVLLECAPAPCRVLLNERPIRALSDAPEALGLPAGSYRVTFERDGYLPHHAEVEVEAGSEASLVIELWPRWRALGE